MRYRPAWKEAKYVGQSARNRALADRANSNGELSQQILHNQLAGMFKRYKFDEQKCFFCGERGHHTGQLTASIWLCKDKACASQYKMAKEDL